MNRIKDVLKKVWEAIQALLAQAPTPAGPVTALPSVQDVQMLYKDTTSWRKVSSIQKASCGLLIATYHNITRAGSWLGLLKPDYETLYASSDETLGTPALVAGWWVYPGEFANDRRLIKVNDLTGEVQKGATALADYSTMNVDGYIAYSKPVRLCAPDGRVVYAPTNFDGFVAGLARRGTEWLLASMDGAKTGIASSTGWVLRGLYPEVAVLNNTILGFAKNGEVHEVANGKVVKVLHKTGNKANRARVKGGLVYWTTADYDQLWVSNGQTAKMLYSWTDGDKQDGVNSGSGFNTSLTFDGTDVIVARSVTNRGVEVWRVRLTGAV